MEEDEGYCSNKGYNLLSKTWSREERDKEKRNKGIDVDRTIRQPGAMVTAKRR
jgi:hypothetical protein